jgi:hypothetical protein
MMYIYHLCAAHIFYDRHACPGCFASWDKMLGVHAVIENVLDKMLALGRGPGIGCGGEGEDENAEERDRIHHGITFIQ